MGRNSKIEWCDDTWNPITGCSVVSPGCTNCYAMKLAGGRLRNHPSRKGLTKPSKAGPVWNGKVRLNEEWLDQPLRWKRPRRIFVCAHGDLFHEDVPDEWIDKIFAVVALAPQHQFQVLTKRADRMRSYISQFRVDGRYVVSDRITSHDPRDGNKFLLLSERQTWPLANVWLGVSVEDQERLERIDHLRQTPAAIRFLSLEPLLEDLGEIDLTGIGWVIVGGESGPGARPMHPDWARSIRDQCVAADGPFFFKQWGAWIPWEPEHGPCWVSQHQCSEDHHNLFPAEMDGCRDWDDGLWAVANGESHAAFQRVGTKRAGRLLDGKIWDRMPGQGGDHG